jgi:hypothetical protein
MGRFVPSKRLSITLTSATFASPHGHQIVRVIKFLRRVKVLGSLAIGVSYHAPPSETALACQIAASREGPLRVDSGDTFVTVNNRPGPVPRTERRICVHSSRSNRIAQTKSFFGATRRATLRARGPASFAICFGHASAVLAADRVSACTDRSVTGTVPPMDSPSDLRECPLRLRRASRSRHCDPRGESHDGHKSLVLAVCPICRSWWSDLLEHCIPAIA